MPIRLNKLNIATVLMQVLPFVTAVTVFATGACNTDAMYDCGTRGAGCSAVSPNCPGQGNVSGTVTDPGSRQLIKSGEPAGWSGYITLPNCTYVCTIGPDCAGQTVNVGVTGGSQTETGPNSCP